MTADPRVTVSGEHHRGMGVTVVLSASTADRKTVRMAEELVRYSTVYAPYTYKSPDGAMVIGTSEVSKQEGGYSETQPPGLYVAPAQRTRSTWVCMVQHSGFHNGPPCTAPGEHPETWKCGWYFHVLVPAPGPGVLADLPGTHPDHC